MGTNYINISGLEVDNIKLKADLSRASWQRLPVDNLGYNQFYSPCAPDWLSKQLLPIWHSMGFLNSCPGNETLLPHVDNGRTCAILIPCTDSYLDVSLDFFEIEGWSGRPGEYLVFDKAQPAELIERAKFTGPILFRNIPHGLTNMSEFDRINLSICFIEPFTYEYVRDLYLRGHLLR